MPKLGSETIEQHRHAVRDAVLDAMPALIQQRGIASVTMSDVTERYSDPGARLDALLHSYAALRAEQPQDGVAVSLHEGDHISEAGRELHALLTDLLAELASTGDVVAHVPPGELATFVLHALSAASRMPSREAVDRLVERTMAGLRGGPG